MPTAAVTADCDGAGLSDSNELALGANPNDPDSDDDGLTDGAEVIVHATNPLDADSDDDGFSDGIEVLAGTDPLDPQDFPPTVPVNAVWGIGALVATLLATGARYSRKR